MLCFSDLLWTGPIYMLFDLHLWFLRGVYACVHMFLWVYECPAQSVCLSGASAESCNSLLVLFMFNTGTSVLRTLWLYMIACNHTDRQQALIGQIQSSTSTALRIGECWSTLVTDNHQVMILLIQFRLVMFECVGLMICWIMECHAKPRAGDKRDLLLEL